MPKAAIHHKGYPYLNLGISMEARALTFIGLQFGIFSAHFIGNSSKGKKDYA